jgi:hypothetical protein
MAVLRSKGELQHQKFEFLLRGPKEMGVDNPLGDWVSGVVGKGWWKPMLAPHTFQAREMCACMVRAVCCASLGKSLDIFLCCSQSGVSRCPRASGAVSRH